MSDDSIFMSGIVLVLQILLGSGYKAPESAAWAVTKLFPEDERSQKVTLDIGAGTGLVADEVWDFASIILDP